MILKAILIVHNMHKIIHLKVNLNLVLIYLIDIVHKIKIITKINLAKIEKSIFHKISMTTMK